MPLGTIGSVSADLTLSQEKQNVFLTQVSPTGYICNMPVTVAKTVDFTNVPVGSTIVSILSENQKPVSLKVKDGVDVRVVDSFESHAKVMVETESGNRFKARGHASFATQNFKNVNGDYQFNDPNFKDDFVKTRVELNGTVLEHQLEVDDRTIFCRHLAAAALMMREENAPMDWKTSRNVRFLPKNLPNEFSSIEFYERLAVDIHTGTQFYYQCAKADMGKTLYAMCGNIARQQTEPGDIEVKFYVVLNNEKDPDGHACALVLRCKMDENKRQTFKIKLYDPNMSFNHVSFAEDRDGLTIKNLKFTDLFPMHEHYEEFDIMHFYELNPEWSEGVTQVEAVQMNAGLIHEYEYLPEDANLTLIRTLTLRKQLAEIGFVKIGEKGGKLDT